MARRSDSSLAALLLTQRLVETPAAPLKAGEYWSVLDLVDDPGTLISGDPGAVARSAGVEGPLADRIAELVAAATSFAFALEDQEQSGLKVVASMDGDYPTALVDRLGRGAPPLLYVVGDTGLLATSMLGVVGSREVAPKAADAARGAAAAAVAHGMGVVSGGAKGVDRLAMGAALEAGGQAVGVLADSLARTVRDAEIRRMVGERRLCLCTPYKPTAGFSVPNAMGRNKIIYGLSQATFVVAADVEKGGTWAGAVEALKADTAPVVVWTGEDAGPGNSKLVDRGARGILAIDDLFPLPGPAERERANPADQLAMDV